MTVAELFYGAENSGNPEHNHSIVEEFLLTLQVIQSDFSIMKRFGLIKAKLKKKNNLVPDADIIIASTAIEKCEFLVTGNTEHFDRINGLKLKIGSDNFRYRQISIPLLQHTHLHNYRFANRKEQNPYN